MESIVQCWVTGLPAGGIVVGGRALWGEVSIVCCCARYGMWRVTFYTVGKAAGMKSTWAVCTAPVGDKGVATMVRHWAIAMDNWRAEEMLFLVHATSIIVVA